MDLWRRDEDESKSLGILVVISYFLVLIVFFFLIDVAVQLANDVALKII